MNNANEFSFRCTVEVSQGFYIDKIIVVKTEDKDMFRAKQIVNDKIKELYPEYSLSKITYLDEKIQTIKE